MIEYELPCCGASTRVEDLSDVARCEDCGIAVELAPETAVVRPVRPAGAAAGPAIAAPALAA